MQQSLAPCCLRKYHIFPLSHAIIFHSYIPMTCCHKLIYFTLYSVSCTNSSYRWMAYAMHEH
uniref:Uncharacterized protein n=1 Tax=Rhizophora mucronata TaxID=61149 RepID=A0A2P2P2R2_RHIMU